MSGMFEPRSDSASRRQERTHQEKKESKKTKRLTIIVITVFTVASLLAFTLNSAIIRRTIPAITIGDVDFNVAEFEFFFNSEYFEYMNLMAQFQGIEGMEGLLPDPHRSLSAQVHDEDTGETWADFFEARTIEAMADVVSLYTAAMEAGFTLSDEQMQQIEFDMEMLAFQAMMSGAASVTVFLQHSFGIGMNEDIYRSIQEFIMTAFSYSEYMRESFTYTTDELRQYYDENMELLGFEDDGDYRMASFRQILITRDFVNPADFEEGEDDPAYLEAVQLAEEEASARAQLVYELFIDAGATEEALLDLMLEHSDDTTEGGFYDNISKAPYRSASVATMRVVEEIEEWLFYENREVSDFELIYTEAFGYHIAYFTGYGELFFEVVAEDRMRTRDHNEWQDNLPDPEAVRRFAFFLVSI